MNLRYVLVLLSLIHWAPVGALASDKATALTAKSVTSISYVFAGAKGIGPSSFGHALLRFSSQRTPSDQDLVIDFAVLTDRSHFSYWRAAGLTLSERYPMQLNLRKYRQVKEDYTIKEDRFLASYELNLTSEEKVKFLDLTRYYLSRNGADVEYDFVGRNCATLVAQMFRALGWSIETVLPANIVSQLYENKKIARVFYDAPSTQERSILSKRFQLSIRDLLPAGASRDFLNPGLDFDKLYLSERFRTRYLAQVSLIELYHQMPESMGKKRVFHFLMDVLRQETGLNRNRLFSHLLHNDIRIIFSKPISKTKNPLTFNEWAKWDNKNDLFLGCRSDCRVISTESLEWKIVTALFNGPAKQLLQTSALYATDLLVYLNPDKESLTLIGLSDLTLKRKKNPEMPVIPPHLMNFEEDSLSLGNCWALAKAFQSMENILWEPENPRLSEKQNLALFESLLTGEIVVIPGFNNPVEWLLAMPLEPFRRILSQYQTEENTGNLLKMVQVDLERAELSADKIPLLKFLLDYEFPVIISYRPKRGVAHVVVATSYVESHGDIRFSGYNSNYGQTLDKLFLFTQRDGRFHFFASPSEGLPKMLDFSLDIDSRIQRLNLVQGVNKTYLHRESKRKNKKSIDPSKIE